MKITNTSIETLGTGAAAGAGAAAGVEANQATQASQAASKSKADSVNLSSASQFVNLAKASSSPERASKVANVAALVRSGQYSTDTASVSQALVEGHIQ